MRTTQRAEPPPHPGRAVDVALAEFNALRAEILSRTTAQSALVGVGLTAVGVIFGFVAREGAGDQLLLAVPPVAAAVSLLSAAETYRVKLIGRYIQERLWPHLRDQVGPLPSWEKEVAGRSRHASKLVIALLLDFPATFLFASASAASLLAVEKADKTLVAVGWVLTSVTLLVPMGIGLIIRLPART